MVRLVDGLVRQAVPYSRALGAGTAVLLVGWLLLGPGTEPDDDGRPGSTIQSCPERIPITVISSTEKVDVMARLAQAYNTADRPPDASCAQVTVRGLSSGVAEQALAGNPEKDPAVGPVELAAVAQAQVWTPTDRLWLDRLSLDTKGRLSLAHQALLAKSLLVVAMPAALAERLGWQRTPPTWHEVMAALQRGQVSYSQENPRTSTSGTLATYLTFLAARVDAGDPGGLDAITVADVRSKAMARFVHDVQGAAVGGFMNDSTNILRTWATSDPDRDALALVQEQMVWGYDRGQYGGRTEDRVPLVAIHPRVRDGEQSESVLTDHPYVVLPSASDRQRRAAGDFLAYVRQHQDQLCAAGFHDPDGRAPLDCAAPPAATETAGMPKGVGTITLGREVVAIRLPPVEVQRELVAQWLAMRPVRRITILMDVSGSMKAERLERAREAVRQGVRSLRKQDQFEVVEFAGSRRETGPYREVIALAEVGDSAQRERTLAALGDDPAVETDRTALFSSANAAYRRLSGLPVSRDRRSLDALIVLSDGINEWHKGVSTASGLCAEWDTVTPHVPVYTVHYAPDRKDGYSAAQVAAGAAALKKLSSCTEPRGFAFDSTRDSTLGAVFRTIMGDL